MPPLFSEGVPNATVVGREVLSLPQCGRAGTKDRRLVMTREEHISQTVASDRLPRRDRGARECGLLNDENAFRNRSERQAAKGATEERAERPLWPLARTAGSNAGSVARSRLWNAFS